MIFNTRLGPFRSAMILIVMGLTPLSCATRIDGWVDPRVARLELEGWRELTSSDFVLYSRGSQEDLESFAVDLARYIAVIERLVDAETPKAPARIVLVDDRAEELFIPNTNILGYMGSTLNGFNSFVRGGPYDPRIRGTLLHEYTHFLTLRNTRLDYPIWYQEGFAEYLGSIRARGDTMEVGSSPAGRLRQLDTRRSREEPIDLEDIFSFNKKSHRSWPSEFYPISWATVHFLNSTPDGQKRLVDMVDAQARGLGWKEAYSNAFSIPLEELASNVEQHAETLSGGTPAAVLYLPIESLDVRTQWTIRDLTPTKALSFLAEIAAHGAVRQTYEYSRSLAIAIFGRALEISPTDSRLHAGLASALAQHGDFETAKVKLAAFRRDLNPSETAIVHAAYATRLLAASLTEDDLEDQSRTASKDAISLYRRALDIAPENPFALAGLGHSLIAMNRHEEAREPLNRARKFGEWDAEVTLNRGRVEAKTGSQENARIFWNEVVRLGSAKQSKEAAALILLSNVSKSGYPSMNPENAK